VSSLIEPIRHSLKDCPGCFYELQGAEEVCESCGAQLKELHFNEEDWEPFLGYVL
jgi:rRNA maturation endonuclease Nob1